MPQGTESSGNTSGVPHQHTLPEGIDELLWQSLMHVLSVTHFEEHVFIIWSLIDNTNSNNHTEYTCCIHVLCTVYGLWYIKWLTSLNNNNNRRLVTLAEHTSDHGRQTNSSTEEKGEQV